MFDNERHKFIIAHTHNMICHCLITNNVDNNYRTALIIQSLQTIYIQ